MENSPCDPSPECPYYGRCRTDRHHLAWPRNEYTSFIERTYRNLGSNIILICRYEHDLIHKEEPPTKPDLEFMAGYIIASTPDKGQVIRVWKELRGE